MFEGFAAREFPEARGMSNDSAEKRQAFQHWVSSLRTDAGADPAGVEESGVTSLDDQATLVRQLPKEVVRLLREREAGRRLDVDPDSTAVFHPPPDLIARARRLVPPKKPERGATPSVPAEPHAEPDPVLPPEAGAPADHESPLPVLADAVELEEPPSAPYLLGPAAAAPAPAELAKEPAPARRSGWFSALVAVALLSACAWFLLTHWDGTLPTPFRVEEPAPPP
jgi:hypothetical protein